MACFFLVRISALRLRLRKKRSASAQGEMSVLPALCRGTQAHVSGGHEGLQSKGIYLGQRCPYPFGYDVDCGTEKHRPSAQGEEAGICAYPFGHDVDCAGTIALRLRSLLRRSLRSARNILPRSGRIKPVLTKMSGGGSIEFSNLQNTNSNKLVRMNHRFKREEGHDAHVAFQKGSNLLGNSAIQDR